MKKILSISAVALILSACAGSGTTASGIAQESFEAGKNAAINTGVNAVSGKLTGTSTSGMTDIAKDSLNSGKNAAIQKATNSLTGATTTTETNSSTTTGSSILNMFQ